MGKEKDINKMLIYMKNDIVSSGLSINQHIFDFKPYEEQILMGGKVKTINEGTSLTALKATLKIKDDSKINELLRECLSRRYIKKYSATSNNLFLLTDEGMIRANEISNKSILMEILKHPLFNTIVSAIIGYLLALFQNK